MTSQVDASDQTPLVIGGGPRIYGSWLLWMLALAYAFNFMDRTVVATLAQAIKVDLLLNDAEIGLLQGFAYVVLYSVAGLPLAWLAERASRVGIITVCLTVWSLMTAVCGAAHGFVQLLLFRIGVGVGEAGCNPCSHSMIADGFRPEQRSQALSIYQIGATAGTAAGAMAAGVIAEHFGWRIAFVAVGVPGVLLALLIRLTVKDPPRKPQAIAAGGVKTSVVLRRLLTSPAMVHLVMGFTVTSFAAGALGAFTQPYFIRAFHLTYGEIGVIFGLSGGIASAACLVVTGRLTDWASRRSARWYVWLPIIGVGASIPVSWAAYTVGDWRVAVAWSFLTTFFLNWFILPNLSAMHHLLGVRLVATGMALILLFQNFLGLGGGPYVTGLIIDGASRHLFAARHLGDFARLCPGGVAIRGASAQVAAGCLDALTGATRIGLLSTVAIRLWACAHYALAALYIRRDLSEPVPAGTPRT